MAERAIVYGSFWIDETEFALPVNSIQEVVNEPESYAPVPLSPPHMVGLFNLRGFIIPVIDLRILLDFPSETQPEVRKIAILENGDLSFGVIFDDTGGIINSDGVAQVKFAANNNGVKDVVVDGVLKFDDGARMVQILNPYEILNIERVPRIHKTEATATPENRLGQRLNCISFQLGHTNCAMDLRFVQEITNVPEVHKSQVAYGHTLGNINLRGRTMPVVDFRGLIGNEPPHTFSLDALKHRKLLILKLEVGYVALLVYSIDSILPFFQSDILPFANMALPRHDLVTGCLISPKNEIVILLDHEKLAQDPVLLEAAQSCMDIYPSEDEELEEGTSKDQKSSHLRETYIVFTVHRRFALEVACISEIINYPSTVLTPPYALHFVSGIMNLRGELITLIDPKKLYGLPSKEEPDAKILIIKSNEKKYGIVVDSVDEMATSQTGTFSDVPSIQLDADTKKVSEDILGCLSLKSAPLGEEPIMVLNVEGLLNRCALEGA